jgi:uncharacterized membrane protein YhaH (DUF805 family)
MGRERPSERRTRRSVFHLWIGLTIVLAMILALVLPFIQGERFAYLAGVPVVALNLVLLALGLGWLAWYVFAPRLRERGRQDGRASWR